ncbi:MAG: hypothetical protein WD010_07660, partial [Nitriliruptor sp.]
MSATPAETINGEPAWRSLARAARVAPSLGRGFRLTLVLALVGTASQIVVPIVVQQVLDGQVLAAEAIDLGAVTGAGAVAVLALVAAAFASRQA